MESLDLLANNLANAGTAGFKSDREFYQIYSAAESSGDKALPLVDREWTDFRQGTVSATGNPMDVALSGKGFFKVSAPSGTLYTRGGNLHLSPKGEIHTAEGYTLEKQGGGALKVDPEIPVEIASDGSVMQAGQPVGKIEISDFPDVSSLRKHTGSYFLWTGAADAVRTADNPEVLQGRLEAANVSTPETAVRLVNVMRQFEMLQRAAAMGGEMNRRAVEEVAKAS
jgi:flagellar basal body rod protein FlgG